MDLFTPIRLGVRVTTDVVKLATFVPRLILHQLEGDNGDQPASAAPTATATAQPVTRVPRVPQPPPATPEPVVAPVPRQGARRETDVRPPQARPRQATTPKRSEIDRRREQAREREAAPAEVVETEGAATPGATIHVDEPWEGYEKLKAPEIVARVNESDAATKAVVRLYEQTHRKRKSIIDATG
jgi:hypothetical protein